MLENTVSPPEYKPEPEPSPLFPISFYPTYVTVAQTL